MRLRDVAACHWDVDVEAWYAACVYDVCACAGDVARCLCPVLGDYAMACAKQGVLIQWRYHVQECGQYCLRYMALSYTPHTLHARYITRQIHYTPDTLHTRYITHQIHYKSDILDTRYITHQMHYTPDALQWQPLTGNHILHLY